MIQRRHRLLSVLALVCAGVYYGCGGTGATTPTSTTAPCTTFALSAPSSTFAANGGSGSFTVTASPGNCPWSSSVVNLASGQTAAVHFTAGATGNGAGTVSYTVDPNPASSARTNDILVALDNSIAGNPSTSKHHIVTSTAATAGCTLTLGSPNAMTFGFAGGTGAISVNASGNTCGWFIDVVSPADDWMRNGAQSFGVGNATANFTVKDFGSSTFVPLPRTGQIWVFDISGLHVLTVSVTQH